jgi:hypothetical protein
MVSWLYDSLCSHSSFTSCKIMCVFDCYDLCSVFCQFVGHTSRAVQSESELEKCTDSDLDVKSQIDTSYNNH